MPSVLWSNSVRFLHLIYIYFEHMVMARISRENKEAVTVANSLPQLTYASCAV